MCASTVSRRYILHCRNALSRGFQKWFLEFMLAEQERMHQMVASGLNKQVKKLKEDKLKLKEELKQVLDEDNLGSPHSSPAHT